MAFTSQKAIPPAFRVEPVSGCVNKVVLEEDLSRYAFREATGHSGALLLPKLGKLIGDGECDKDWFLNKNPSRTGRETPLRLKTILVRSIAANSDALLPDATATKKRVFMRSSSKDRLEESLVCRAPRAESNDQDGITCLVGGFSLNWALASREKTSWLKSTSKAAESGSLSALRCTKIDLGAKSLEREFKYARTSLLSTVVVPLGSQDWNLLQADSYWFCVEPL